MKSKPDLMSILGFIIVCALIFVGCTLSTADGVKLVPSNMKNFFDIPSVAIVIGGTITALMISCPGSQLAKIPKHLMIIFSPKQYDPNVYIEQLVSFARKARINGLLALEEDLANIEDAFLKSSMVMVVDSVDPEKVKQQLEARLDNLTDRHAQDRAIYSKGASYGPAFGMIGTLIGLINLLKDLEDASKIGPNMAVALITTFYGTLLANVIFNPINSKLQARHEEEFLCCLIICEGVQAIQAGENPKFIQERLMNLLPQYKQKTLDTEGGSD
ncbi:MAG: MotA/TolQ/ExbB proton channel family protein [Clostridiales bacterium]|nr:MotA/TolQ/ExbB proton channel family protein [Clostridiales bacterium]